MNRQELISRLVARKLQNASDGRVGCVPCFGAAGRVICVCMAGPAKKSQQASRTTKR